METTVKVQWEGQEVDIVLRSLTYGEYKKIKRKSIINVVVGGKTVQKRDLDLYDELFIVTSIKEAPFDKTIANISKLSISDGKLLENAVTDLNFPKNEG